MVSRTLAAVVLVAAVSAATACGGDDSETSGGAATSAGKVDSTSSTAAGVGGTNDGPASMEAWEALWAEERAAVVARIEENGWGKSADGTQLTGPEGFTIDLSACAAGWSDTEGLTDTEIKIGYPLPQSGPAAESGGLGYSQEALFAHYNAQGAFTDVNGKTRNVTMFLRDDAYDAARTIPLVDELIDSERVFAIETTGSPSTLRTYEKLNQRCIPQVLPGSGHPAFGDPVNHPWTTTSSINYATEAVLWGTFLEERLDELGGQAKIAALRINSDFGASYHAALTAYLETSEHKDDIEYVSETIEPTAATVKDEMTTLAAGSPDMFIAMTTGSSCSQMVSEAAINGMKEDVPYKFLSSACKVTTPVQDLGDASDGWWTVGGALKDVDVEAYDDDPFAVAARQWVADIDREVSQSYNLGLYYGWTLAQGLQIAGQLDGGLTRSNLILALRSIDMTNPMLVGGLKVKMDGNADAFMLEGSDISYWSTDEQAWVQDSIVELDVQTPNCAWDQSEARCR
ncbi:MAG: ABC transporter substrate-binding protein [Acidimicrobiia bacterium]|nr:ABC transporter substrate-binding protein [Acidimicrobiia bacterium]